MNADDTRASRFFYRYEKDALSGLNSAASNALRRATINIPPRVRPTRRGRTMGRGPILAGQQHQHHPVAEWKVFAVAT